VCGVTSPVSMEPPQPVVEGAGVSELSCACDVTATYSDI